MDFNLIEEKFLLIYNNSPLLVRAPGRINLIGEHTDYNEGFVLPAAINKEIVFAVAKNGSSICRFYSYDLEETCEVHISEIKPCKKSWGNYLIGVIAQFQKAGHTIEGFDCVFGGDIPIGAGLSSSAAMECGMAYSLNKLFRLNENKQRLVHFAQKAEHEFAGVQCGIMDQFSSIMGREDHAIRLDCRTLDYSYFPINLEDYQLVLCDTNVKHTLASSEYNTRRMECEKGVKAAKTLFPEVKSLRDLTVEMLVKVKPLLSPVIYNRCRYVVEENERVLLGCELLENGDIKGFGEKMYGSHEGLSKLYEVSCRELDFLVDFTKDKDYVAGSRMMGGGFGGCTINLVAAGKKEEFKASIKAAYEDKFNVELEIYVAEITNGTEEIVKDEMAAINKQQKHL